MAAATLLGVSTIEAKSVAAVSAYDLVFHLTLCSPSEWHESPCYVEQVPSSPPPPGAKEWIAAGLTEYFDPGFQFPAEAVGILGSNASGHIIGTLWYEPYNAHFIARDGQILCCQEDFPWGVHAINDHGIIIGRTDEYPTISDTVEAFHVLPRLDDESVVLAKSLIPSEYYPDQDFNVGHFFHMGLFFAIDNNNRIFGTAHNLTAS